MRYSGVTISTTDGTNAFLDVDNDMQKFLNGTGIVPRGQIPCPMPSTKEFLSDPTPVSAIEAEWYESTLGSLIWFAVVCRIDIAFAVSRLGRRDPRCTTGPTRGAMRAMFRCLGYLTQHPTLKLGGRLADVDTLQIFSDSDFAGDKGLTKQSQGPIHSLL